MIVVGCHRFQGCETEIIFIAIQIVLSLHNVKLYCKSITNEFRYPKDNTSFQIVEVIISKCVSHNTNLLFYYHNLK